MSQDRPVHTISMVTPGQAAAAAMPCAAEVVCLVLQIAGMPDLPPKLRALLEAAAPTKVNKPCILALHPRQAIMLITCLM